MSNSLFFLTQHLWPSLRSFFLNNCWHGLTTAPTSRDLPFILTLSLVFVAFASHFGLSSGLLHLHILRSDSPFSFYPSLCVLVLVFPCAMEEIVFRGLMIPNRVRTINNAADMVGTSVAVCFNAALFTAWHPINARLFNTRCIPLFTEMYFLLIVYALGLVCALTYVLSRSLWPPIFIHWITVILWIICFDGHSWVLHTSSSVATPTAPLLQSTW